MLPYLSVYSKYESQLVNFGGLNLNNSISDGEFSDCENISVDEYPFLAQRKGRTLTHQNISAIYGLNKLCYIQDGDFYYDGECIGSLSEGEKQCALINTKLVIFPDKVYFDFSEDEDLEVDYSLVQMETEAFSIEESAVFTHNSIQFNPSSSLGELASNYGQSYYQTSKFYTKSYSSVEYVDGELVTTDEQVVYGVSAVGRYIIPSGSNGNYAWPFSWGSNDFESENTDGVYGIITHANAYDDDDTSYIVYEQKANLFDANEPYVDFDTLFKVGDAVTISGCTDIEENNMTVIIRSIDGDILTFDDNIFTLDDGETEHECDDIISLKREVPDLDFICQSENRLFGTCGTIIYASALGDPTNFNFFDGLSTDSYQVTVVSSGEFTGCIAYSSSVLFFKENMLYRLMGSYPSEYYMYDYIIDGVQAGAHKSLQIINEVLYYKGVNSIYAYSGSTPYVISTKLDYKKFFCGVAGVYNGKYYISMYDENEDYSLFVYDTKKGLWIKEDSLQVIDFALVDNTFYMLTGTDVYTVDTGDFTDFWSATLPFYYDYINAKKYSHLYIRAEIFENSWLKIEVSKNNAPFKQVYLTHDKSNFTVPIPINRVDSLVVRFSGKGQTHIKNLTYKYKVGGKRI